mmetsp:Transcript_11525/g.49666  ORF Transcript_11525/g.49666 Transcript_11525/m.49666 type:complete len:389 (+) Transcript_11525:285-1451(+)
MFHGRGCQARPVAVRRGATHGHRHGRRGVRGRRLVVCVAVHRVRQRGAVVPRVRRRVRGGVGGGVRSFGADGVTGAFRRGTQHGTDHEREGGWGVCVCAGGEVPPGRRRRGAGHVDDGLRASGVGAVHLRGASDGRDEAPAGESETGQGPAHDDGRGGEGAAAGTGHVCALDLARPRRQRWPDADGARVRAAVLARRVDRRGHRGREYRQRVHHGGPDIRGLGVRSLGRRSREGAAVGAVCRGSRSRRGGGGGKQRRRGAGGARGRVNRVRRVRVRDTGGGEATHREQGFRASVWQGVHGVGVRRSRRAGGRRVPVRGQGGLHCRARGRHRAVHLVRYGCQMDAQAWTVPRGVEGGHRRGKAGEGRGGCREWHQSSYSSLMNQDGRAC